jgi:predicted DNA-binding WGR domain protein
MTDIELRMVDPAHNRFRLYGLTECRTLFGEPCLIIGWGRIGHRLRRRTEVFADYGLLEHRRSALLARRRRNGYAPLASPRITEVQT